MRRKLNIIRTMLCFKNRMIKRERDRAQAQEWANRILSAYLALLVEENQSVRVPREMVRSAIGKYSAQLQSVGDDYLITVKRTQDGVDGEE
ncbi:MAG: hypothetical protein IJY39_09740 [Clostridia bacterium]|nr:hypothetical protein [Clostridia bacterium]